VLFVQCSHHGYFCWSFKTLVAGICDSISRDRSCLLQVVPLCSCKKDISSHLRSNKFAGSSNEVDLILSRASIFEIPKDLETFTICPAHRSVLGVGWSRGCNTRCRVPKELSGHGKTKPKANRGINKISSQLILNETGIFIQPGSGKPNTLLPELLGRFPLICVSISRENESDSVKGNLHNYVK